MTGRGVLLALVVATALLAWLFFSKSEIEAPAPIEHYARGDLAAACNQVAAETGRTERFAAGDVTATRLQEAQMQGGVVAMVSVLEARRGNLLCRWNGTDPATISSAD